MDEINKLKTELLQQIHRSLHISGGFFFFANTKNLVALMISWNNFDEMHMIIYHKRTRKTIQKVNMALIEDAFD